MINKFKFCCLNFFWVFLDQNSHVDPMAFPCMFLHLPSLIFLSSLQLNQIKKCGANISILSKIINYQLLMFANLNHFLLVFMKICTCILSSDELSPYVSV